MLLGLDGLCSHDVAPELWQRTYLKLSPFRNVARYSFVLRRSDVLAGGTPDLDPFTSYEGELLFLEVAEALFLQGASQPF